MRHLRLFLVLATLAGVAPYTAHAEECPSTITSARIDPLPLFGADLETQIGAIRGKTSENSMSLTIATCTEQFYFVEAPSLGPAAIRRRQARTDAQMELPICDSRAPVSPNGSISRSGHGATDGNLCRRR